MAGRRKQALFHREQQEARQPPGDSDPHGLLALCDLLFRSTDGSEILRMAMAQVGALAPFRLEAGYLLSGDGIVRVPSRDSAGGEAVDRRVRELAEADGPVAVPTRLWGWAFGLRGFGRLLGYLVVSSRQRPSEQDDLLIGRLIRLTSAALSLAAAGHRQQHDALELSRLREEHATAVQRLDSLRSEMRHQRIVHETLAEVAAGGGGEDAITHALYELTGLAAVAEDRFGNLRSWAGPGRPGDSPAPPAERRQEVLRQVALGPGPVRIKDRLIALARPRGEVLGVLAVVDPDGTADERTLFALEHAVRSLALELAHVRGLAEVELRLRRQLLEDLLEGTDEASAYARSEAVGHDLHRAHHVIVVNWWGRTADDSFTQAVERAAATVGVRALVTRRGGRVVLLAEVKPNGDALHAALSRELGTRDGAIGVSRRCESPASIPRRYQEALRALEVRRQSRERDGATFFDDLGLYRILGPGSDRRELEAFVGEWLGTLIDYDEQHGTQMVETLSRYFDCGGNYDETAAALTVHRSTLRYRLQRIREIGGRDLADVDTRLSLQVATRVWKIMLGGRG
ncbi:PucR family transcriptional regulator [Streptomyces cylindrosporus]|uniref:Helix-turn-helix domain-containing protein n=1 Tax=Streptomyces cylindrosporus TaxID=2927583 RepID=A0ABS9Y490_9ACTN|nr:helix-turn-helix domain-containing protein [Streptomyces cylindrosporus]MCI3271829.1 helix-turn-helix domain-containing protein [Streptomyces cylindrosporus]